MSARIVSYTERPDLDDRWDDIVRPAWPAFMRHDAVCNENWHFLWELFPDCTFYLYDYETDVVLGIGNSIPFAWDGTAAGLPGGIDDVLLLGIDQRRTGVAPTALSALQAVVRVDRRGEGLSSLLVDGMRTIAASRGFTDLVAPVRPNRKGEYPLIPMERYMRWTREDGLPFDPWLRVHARLGAEIVQEAPRSMVIEATVAEWESWASMALPDTGDYTVPGALTPVHIDREADVGRYVEPNVWMRHPVRAS